jgi:hypothetical protein
MIYRVLWQVPAGQDSLGHQRTRDGSHGTYISDGVNESVRLEVARDPGSPSKRSISVLSLCHTLDTVPDIAGCPLRYISRDTTYD